MPFEPPPPFKGQWPLLGDGGGGGGGGRHSSEVGITGSFGQPVISDTAIWDQEDECTVDP